MPVNSKSMDLIVAPILDEVKRLSMAYDEGARFGLKQGRIARDALRDRVDELEKLFDAKCKESSELKIELSKWVNYWRDKDNKALQARIAALEAENAQFREALAKGFEEFAPDTTWRSGDLAYMIRNFDVWNIERNRRAARADLEKK